MIGMEMGGKDGSNKRYPLIIQTFLIFGIAYGVCYLLKMPHDIAAPAGMIGASNFFELAVAVAIALFGKTFGFGYI